MSYEEKRKLHKEQWDRVQRRLGNVSQDTAMADLRTQLLTATARAEAAEAKLAASADELKRLMVDTDVILGELNPQEIKGAINWGDLFAAEVTRVFDAAHRTWLRIVIEEVSPGTETLIDAVRVGLAAKGWDVTSIAIETEW